MLGRRFATRINSFASGASEYWPSLTGKPSLIQMVQRAATVVPEKHDRYRIVWAPHHSYGPLWLNFGTLSKIRNEMLSFAREHENVDIIFKPHPFLLGTMTDRGLMTQSEVDEWTSAWEALPNTSTNTDSDYVSLFINSDMMICDGISFLGEYPLITGRPAVFIERSDHWAFSPLGETIAKTSIRYSSFAEFAENFDVLKANGLPDRTKEIDQFLAEATPYPGKAAKRIVRAIRKDFEKHTPLIDPASVTESTWEQEADARRAAGAAPEQPQ